MIPQTFKTKLELQQSLDYIIGGFMLQDEVTMVVESNEAAWLWIKQSHFRLSKVGRVGWSYSHYNGENHVSPQNANVQYWLDHLIRDILGHEYANYGLATSPLP